MDTKAPHWSDDVRQADWIGPRLSSWDDRAITMFVPAGFEAYARVLHPVDVPEEGGSLVRWADVAAWSGLPLRADAQFHSIALPPADPGRPYPFQDGQGPREGTLYTEDAKALAAIVRGWTSAPEDCWFCAMDCSGWDAVSVTAVLTADGEPPEVVEEAEPVYPVPGPVRDGPRVRLPNREYLLYAGPVEDVTATAGLGITGLGVPDGQCATIWWPADLTTCRGSVEARLRRPGRLRKGALTIQVTGTSGNGSTGETTLSGGDDLPEDIAFYLTLTVLGLAGM